MENQDKYWRERLTEMLLLFHEADRMLSFRSMSGVKFVVVLHAKIYIEIRIAGYINRMNGIAGEW